MVNSITSKVKPKIDEFQKPPRDTTVMMMSFRCRFVNLRSNLWGTRVALISQE